MLTGVVGGPRHAVVLLALALAASGVACSGPGAGAGRSAPAAATSPHAASPTGPPGGARGTPAAGPSPTPEPGFTLVATGDLLIHGPVARAALAYGHGRRYDFTPMLARVRAQIAAADLALCHVETPLSRDDRGISGYPRFNTPHELADAIAWAGFDGCSTASNHSFDRGVAGVRDTLDALDRVRVAHAGTARDAREATRVELHRVGGAVVAHLSYTYGTNGVDVPAGTRWAVNRLSVPAILADARRARAAGATFVVASLHWGEEYSSPPTAEQQAQARRLLASPDVDLLLGDHVHVQQPVAKLGDKYVVYGMGNLLSNQSPREGLRPQTQDGGVVSVHVVRRGTRFVADGVTVTATLCDIPTYVVLPVASTVADPSTRPSLRRALEASLTRTRAIHAGTRALQGVARVR